MKQTREVEEGLRKGYRQDLREDEVERQVRNCTAVACIRHLCASSCHESNDDDEECVRGPSVWMP